MNLVKKMYTYIINLRFSQIDFRYLGEKNIKTRKSLIIDVTINCFSECVSKAQSMSWESIG